MTRKESAIIGAYTGILVGPFDALHEYIEEILKRPVFTHELGDKKVVLQIKEASKNDFMNLVNSIK